MKHKVSGQWKCAEAFECPKGDAALLSGHESAVRLRHSHALTSASVTHSAQAMKIEAAALSVAGSGHQNSHVCDLLPQHIVMWQ